MKNNQHQQDGESHGIDAYIEYLSCQLCFSYFHIIEVCCPRTTRRTRKVSGFNNMMENHTELMLTLNILLWGLEVYPTGGQEGSLVKSASTSL